MVDMDVLGTAEGLGDAEEKALGDRVKEVCGEVVRVPVAKVDGLEESLGDEVPLVVASVSLNHVPRMTIP